MKRMRLGLLLTVVLAAACGGPGGPAASTPPGATPTGAATSPAGATATPVAGAMTYERLLSHLPPAANECEPAEVGDSGASLAAACSVDRSLLGPGVEASLVYFWFDHFRKADTFFGDQIDRLGDQFGEDCSVEPSHYLQEVDGELIGRVLCAGDPAAGETLEAVWGDSRLDVVGGITLDGGSYADLGELFEAAQLVP